MGISMWRNFETILLISDLHSLLLNYNGNLSVDVCKQLLPESSKKKWHSLGLSHQCDVEGKSFCLSTEILLANTQV